MQDRELAVGRHDGQAVGLGHAARDLREELRRATPTEIGNPNQLGHVAPSRTAISVGEPASRCIPRTSRNASLIAIPSRLGEAAITRTAR
jgi:hypothetical protein